MWYGIEEVGFKNTNFFDSKFSRSVAILEHIKNSTPYTLYGNGSS